MPIVRVCAWCDSYMGAGNRPLCSLPRTLQAWMASRGATLTHGMCAECLRQAETEIEPEKERASK